MEEPHRLDPLDNCQCSRAPAHLLKFETPLFKFNPTEPLTIRRQSGFIIRGSGVQN